MNYGFSDRNQSQGLGAGAKEQDIYEGEFPMLHQLESGTAWATRYEIKVSPQLIYRKLYIMAYNDAGTANSYCHGRLTFTLSGRSTFSQLFTFAFAGTAPILTGLPTLGAFMPGNQTGAGTSTDGIIITRPITAGYIFISPLALVLTADTVVWETIQQVASASRAVMLLACKSMKGPY